MCFCVCSSPYTQSGAARETLVTKNSFKPIRNTQPNNLKLRNELKSPATQTCEFLFICVREQCHLRLIFQAHEVLTSANHSKAFCDSGGSVGPLVTGRLVARPLAPPDSMSKST